MAGQVIDRAFVEILPKLDKLQSETKAGVDRAFKGAAGSVQKSADNINKSVDRSMGGARKSSENAARGISGAFMNAKTHVTGQVKLMAAGIAGIFAATKIVGFLKGSIDEAREAQRVNALTAQVIKSTGAQAGITVGHVTKLATAISNYAGVDDEAVQASENLLLTFTNLRNGVGKGNDVFDQATKLALDMSTALGTDLHGASIQVGKALNDPIKGITALSRAGVSFSAQQKEQIKTLVQSGNTLGAQKIILGELSKEFGGAAAAAATPAQKLKVAYGNLQESVGTLLLPVLDKTATFMFTYVIPAIYTLGSIIGKTVTAVRGFAHWVDQTRAPLITAAGIIITVLLPSIIAFGVATVTSVGTSIALWAMYAAESVVSAVKASAAYVMLNLAAFKSMAVSVATFAVMVAKWVWLGAQSLIAAAKVALAWLIAMGPVGIVIAIVAGLVLFIIKNWNTIWQWTTRIFTNVVNFLKQNWMLILAVITGPLGLLVLFIIRNWATIKSTIINAAQSVLQFLASIPGKILGFFAAAGRLLVNVGSSIVMGLYNGIRNTWFGQVAVWWLQTEARILGYLGRAGTWLVGIGRVVIGGLYNGMKAMWNTVTGWFTSLPSKILDVLGIHSPPGWAVNAGKWIMKGLLKGIISDAGGAAKFMARWAKERAKDLAGGVAGLVSIGSNSDMVNKLIKGLGGGLGGQVQAAMAIAGVGMDWFAPLLRRIMYESGGNAHAINLTDQNAREGHPSMGLMQTIQATFDAYAKPGMHDIWNPVDNLVAAIGYIKSRYGSIHAIDPPVSGYKSGSWEIMRDQLASLHKGEMIIPAGPASNIRKGGRSGGFPSTEELAAAVAAGVRAGLAGMGIRFDSDGLARMIEERSNFTDTKGARR